MYPIRESMDAKVKQLILIGLYPEALIVAQEITKRWPEHPIGYSYLTELYGNYYGMGNKAAEEVQQGLQCKGVRDTPEWEFLTIHSWRFANNPDQKEIAIENIIKYFPKCFCASSVKDYKLFYRGIYSTSGMAADCVATYETMSDENAGLKASFLDLACSLMLNNSEINSFRSIFESLIMDLRSVDDQMFSHRQSLGLGFAPVDRLSMKYRAELCEKFIPKYFPKDPKMYNRWAGTYSTLESYEKFHQINSVALELELYDKPLINKANVLKMQGANDKNIGDLNSARNKFNEAIACLEEAIRLGGEPHSQQKAHQDIDQVKVLLSTCAINNVSIFVSKEKLRNYSEGIEKYRQIQMRYDPFLNALPPAIHAKLSAFAHVIAARNAKIRFNTNEYSCVLQCAIELMEDMLPPFAFSIISRFRSQGRTFELFTLALSDIASNIEKYGAMHRDAQETLAILLLEANGPENIHQTFLCLNTLFPHLSETILHSIHITFGSQLEISLQGIIKTEQPPSLPDDFIWWRTTKSSESTKDNSLFQKLFRMIK
jgi:tetratricopeptide (TPR) repeat protein